MKEIFEYAKISGKKNIALYQQFILRIFIKKYTPKVVANF